MVLEFMYVPGISDNNTFRFYSETARDNYFLLRKNATINQSYYPPKYRDAIRIDTTDVSFSTVTNYMRFSYNNMYYYYFIESVSYINENLIEIDIRMDTLMTYYFHLSIVEGIVERAHINRWTNITTHTINRNYIRENASAGLFIEQQKNYIVAPTAIKWLIVKLTAELRTGDNYKHTTYIKSNINTKSVVLPYGLAIGPMDNRLITITADDGFVENVTYPYTNVLAGAKDDRVVDIYVCPFQPIEEISYDGDGGLRVYKLKQTVDNSVSPCIEFRDNYNSYSTLFGYWSDITPKVHSALIPSNPLNIVPNAETRQTFSRIYEPALLDENYIRLVAGSNTANITYPTHAIIRSNTDYRFKYICNVDDGTKTYWLYRIDSTLDDEYSSRFNAITVDSNILSMSLSNDPWTSYMANIKGRIFSTGMAMGGMAVNAFADIGVASAKAKIARVKILKDPRNYDRRYKKKLRLKTRYRERLEAINESARDSYLDTGVGAAESLLNSGLSEVSNAYNTIYTAPSPKQVGNFTAGDTANQMSLWYQYSIVDDIDFVANYYHKYGNLINEIYTPGNTPWYRHYDTRYYYNYVKFVDLIASLDLLAEDEVLADITGRFTDGITFWNSEFNIGSTYNYDNVEKEYING